MSAIFFDKMWIKDIFDMDMLTTFLKSYIIHIQLMKNRSVS